MARRMRHRQTKGPETAGPDLNHRATSRLYDRPHCPIACSKQRRSGGPPRNDLVTLRGSSMSFCVVELAELRGLCGVASRCDSPLSLVTLAAR
jgi:hypothetical protein